MDLALDAGACGARLTGAGFGGSVVALADEDTAITVAAHWRDAYGRPRGLTDAVFVADPSEGASVAGA